MNTKRIKATAAAKAGVDEKTARKDRRLGLPGGLIAEDPERNIHNWQYCILKLGLSE